MDSAHRDRQIAGYAALAVAIHILEAALPSPVPGIKPGLANVVTLIVLFRYGFGFCCWVAALRVLVSSLLLGSFLTPTFMLSAAGALASLAALALAAAWNRHAGTAQLTAVGCGAAAACAHMGGQFVVAWQLFIPHPGLLVLLPTLLTAALAFGLVSGWIAAAVLQRLPPLAGDKALPGY